MTPRLDHRKARANAGGASCQAWVSGGTAQPIEPTSYPSHIWIRVQIATTRICKAQMRWFSIAASTAGKAASAIVVFLRSPLVGSVACSGAPRKARMKAVLGDHRRDDHIPVRSDWRLL